MGGDIGQRSEWQHEGQIEWHLLQHPEHEGMRRWVADLNRCHVGEAALHQRDFEGAGFEWVIADDADHSVIAFLRKSRDGHSTVLVVCNFTPVLRDRYRVGVPLEGRWTEILNSDASHYGGSGVGNYGGVHTVPVTAQGRYHSLTLALPPLGALYLKHEG
jgi:1,4-alpha-glucan branching enzyme